MTAPGPPAATHTPDPAGSDPAGLDPAGLDPAGLDPAGLDPAGLDPAGLEPGDLAGPAGCGASAILARGGPTAVPFDLCCVLTLVRAGGTDPGPSVCRALEMLDVDQPLVAEPAP